MSSLYGFFFSSRRRHTSLVSDWSSDVCSSDLFVCYHLYQQTKYTASSSPFRLASGDEARLLIAEEIGRASCRERVNSWVVERSSKEVRALATRVRRSVSSSSARSSRSDKALRS